MYRIEADRLLPGDGAPVPDGVVVLDGTEIVYAGPAGGAPETPGAVTTRAATVMPGLWDCHAHFLGLRRLDLDRLPLEPVELRAARCSVDLRAALDAGVTSVREVGGLGVYLARAVDEGTLAGPRVYAAGSILSATAGHADLHTFPAEWVAEYGRRGGELRLCDGPDDVMRAVREQLRKNARVIKVCASGGVLSELDDPRHQLFTVAEIRAAVETAALSERAVAAHCHGKAGIMAALEAGVLTIEHGTYIDDECAAAMREAGAILVATRTIVEELRHGGDVPAYARAKIARVAEEHTESVARAHEHGVTIASGTDIALSAGAPLNSWGRNAEELPLLVESGMTPAEAIRAATVHGPLTLGPQAPRSGRLEAGYDADVVTLDVDPLADVTVFRDPVHVTDVWVRGNCVKGDGAAVPADGGPVPAAAGAGAERRPPHPDGAAAARSGA